MELTAKMLQDAMDTVLAEPFRPFVPMLSPRQYEVLKAAQRDGESEIDTYYRLCVEAVKASGES